jgi:hypothetical protein
MRCKRKGIGYYFGLLMSMPWHVSVLLGEFVFVGCKWILPALTPVDSTFHLVALTLADLAWPLSGIFLIMGAYIFASQKKHWRHPPIHTVDMFPDR